MKLVMFLFTLAICFWSFCQASKLDKRKSFYSHARNGLILREGPDLNSQKDRLISYADKVKLVSILDTVFNIDGLSGACYQVDYSGHQGFVFSAYLSETPMKVKNGKRVYLKDYAFENLNQTAGDESFKME
jgi:hypothetical protein